MTLPLELEAESLTPGERFFAAFRAELAPMLLPWSQQGPVIQATYERAAAAFSHSVEAEEVEAVIVAVLDTFHDGQREKKARAIVKALRSTAVGEEGGSSSASLPCPQMDTQALSPAGGT